METAKDIVIILLSAFGIIGGLLSLPDKWKEFRLKRRPLGDRGTTHIVLSLKDEDGMSAVTFLVEGDIFHFISAYVKPELQSEFISLEKFGDFHKVSLKIPTDLVPNLKKVKKKD